MVAVESLFKNGLLWLAEPAQEYSQSALEPRDRSTTSFGVAPFGLDAIDQALPWSGLPSGTIHEWSSSEGFSPCSVLALLAGNLLRRSTSLSAPSKFVVWVGKNIWPTPYLLEQTMYVTVQEGERTTSRSLLDNCLFIDPPQEKLKLWAIDLALRSPAVAVVIAECKKLSFAMSRKFALAAKQGGTLGLFVREKTSHAESSAAFSRWSLEPRISSSESPRFELSLLKCKGAQPKIGAWIIEMREGVCSYEPNQQTISLHIPADVGGELGAAQPCPLAARTVTDSPKHDTRTAAHR